MTGNQATRVWRTLALVDDPGLWRIPHITPLGIVGHQILVDLAVVSGSVHVLR